MSIWILEASVFRTGSEPFEHAVRQAGGEARWISVEEEFYGRYGTWEEGETVVFRGSFEAAESFRSRRPDATPGVIGEPEALKCSSYYSALGEHLLNVEHEFLPLAELGPRWTALRHRYGESLFVRPDSGAKAFTGQVVSYLELFEANEKPYLDAMDPGAQILVAAAREVETEWRMVIVDGTVVAGCRYGSHGRPDVDPEVPTEVLSWARKITPGIKPPAGAYMLDVAREKGGRLAVVELNSFSCSAIYACEPAPVVEAVEAWIYRL